MVSEKLIEAAYEPMCEKCSDHGFLIVGYGESGSGSKQCPECKGRYVKRRKEALAALARDDKNNERTDRARVHMRDWANRKYAANPWEDNHPIFNAVSSFADSECALLEAALNELDRACVGVGCPVCQVRNSIDVVLGETNEQ